MLRRDGFSLVEVLIAASIFAGISVVVLRVIDAQSQASQSIISKKETLQHVDDVHDRVSVLMKSRIKDPLDKSNLVIGGCKYIKGGRGCIRIKILSLSEGNATSEHEIGNVCVPDKSLDKHYFSLIKDPFNDKICNVACGKGFVNVIKMTSISKKGTWTKQVPDANSIGKSRMAGLSLCFKKSKGLKRSLVVRSQYMYLPDKTPVIGEKITVVDRELDPDAVQMLRR